jgi:GT2 family glycosyltransferase
MELRPLFFILTANYNYGRFLGDALLSVRHQSEVTVTHHVQDGGSTDISEDVIARNPSDYLTFDSRPDGGMSEALNRGLANVPPSAKYIGWLNADEFYLPGTLQHVKELFENHAEVDVVYGDTYRVDERGDMIRLLAQHGFSKQVLSGYGAYIQTSSLFLRRNVLENGDLRLDETFRQSMDLELYLHLVSKGYTFLHTRRPLSAFRVHEAQLTKINGPRIALAEHGRLANRYNYGNRPRLAAQQHRLLKLFNGAYLRERIARRMIGQSLRWF